MTNRTPKKGKKNPYPFRGLREARMDFSGVIEEARKGMSIIIDAGYDRKAKCAFIVRQMTADEFEKYVVNNKMTTIPEPAIDLTGIPKPNVVLKDLQ